MSLELVAQRIAELESAFAPRPVAAPAPPPAQTPLAAGGPAGSPTFASTLQSAMAPPAAGAGPTPFAPGITGGGAPAGSYANLTGDLDANPEVLSKLDRMAGARGERWTVTSGLRTDAEQAELYANRANNPYPVAKPGSSIHRTGQGADVTIGGRAIQDVIPAGELRAAGLEPLVGDAVHVQLAGTLR